MSSFITTKLTAGLRFGSVVGVSFVMLLAGCGNDAQEDNQQIPIPQITVTSEPRIVRCEAVLVSEGESVQKVYRNFYIEVREDGTESIVNQVEGDTPCP